MRAIIFTEGGQNIGYGHVTRCCSLYDEFKKQNISVKLFINGDIEDQEILSDKNIGFVNWMTKDILDEICEQIDFCIVDSYLADLEVYQYIANRIVNCVYLDDFNRINYPNGIVVNPSLRVPVDFYSGRSHNLYLNGSDYIILRNEFLAAKRPRVNKSVKKILVTMGGTDIRELTPKIVNMINSTFQKLIIVVVIGTKKYNAPLNEIKSDNINYYYNIDAAKMKTLVLESDIVVTTAGQTVHELISTKTPFIPIKVARNQENNSEALVDLRLVDEVLDCNDALLLDKLIEKLREFMMYSKRNEKFIQYQDYINSHGAHKIIETLIKVSKAKETYIKFKTITEKDCKLLYEWANDSLVRENAFDNNKIKYEDHKKWFEKSLKNKNRFIFIVFVESQAIGQVRIDISEGSGLIDYSISSNYRGLGYGTMLLKTLVNRANSLSIPVIELIGRVKVNNIPSQKVFEKSFFDKKVTVNYIEYTKKLE